MPAYWLEALVVLLGLLLLLMEAFGSSSRKDLIRCVALGGLVFVLILLTFARAPDFDSNAELARFYAWDRPAIFFKTLALSCTILVLFMSYDYRKVLNRLTENPDSEEGTGEYYTLPVFACAGMMWAASARDLVSIFIALELITITFYILVSFMRRNVGSLEAGVKYLILGALSTALMVYGIAWIYGTTGSTNLAAIQQALATTTDNPLAENPAPVLFGLALIILALAFKVGAVPMQLWIPDVYQGAPTPTTAFLSVGSKAAGVIVTLRLLEPFFESPITGEQTMIIVLCLAGLTILVGNLSAIHQTNFKRLLAYSSIAHAGVILLAISAWNHGSDVSLSTHQAVAFNIGTYFLITTGAFFVLVVVRTSTGQDDIAAFDGLGRRNPLLALCTTILLAALAGLPLTVGFFAKYFAILVAVNTAHTNPLLWWGVGISIIGVAAGFYYYFKVVRSMYWHAGSDEEEIIIPRISKFAIVGLSVVTIVLGFWPNPILWLIGT